VQWLLPCLQEGEGWEEKTLGGLKMSVVSMKELLEAGVHFGHQVKRWDPRMKEYIFTERNGIHIFDLKLTEQKIEEAYSFVVDVSKQGGKLIFVGTKKAAQDIVKEEAERCGMFYINERWVGGLLTNFQTVRTSINRLKELEKLEQDGYFETVSVKELVQLQRELAKLRKLYGGVKDMVTLPWAIFVTDTHKERSAILEARKIKIPVIAICDTNSNPEEVDFPIPANDDAIRSLRLITSTIANAVIEGREGKVEKEEVEEEEEISQEEILEKDLDFEDFEDYKE
jgi:small subunit ribosomal protein S2